jgi:hypothetical protein
MTDSLNVVSTKSSLNVVSATKKRAAQIPAAAPSIVVPISGLQASVKLLDLAPGLYAVTIEPAPVPPVSLGGMTLPATLVTPLGNAAEHAAEIFPGDEGGNWIGPGGGTVVLRIPTAGGRSLITTYRGAQQEAAPLSIKIASIGQPATTAAPPVQHHNGAAPESSTATVAPTLPTEITFCIDQACGQATAGEWAGTPGSKRFLEAFGIVPQGHIEIDGIEYKAFGPNGRETPWVSSGKLCGSRGKNVALTGFAIRPAEHLREKIDIVYEGAFAGSGRIGPCRNGEPCRGTQTDDPMEAISLRIVSRP